jgi:hypothetical protein
MRQHITRRVGILLATVALALTVPLAVFASHQFTDVPNSNLYHADIDALVDSGVTSGCGGGRYCPNNFVTRGEMAAFMNRLGALAPGKTPVVNATTVDGLSASAFHRYNATAPGGSKMFGMFNVSGNAAGSVYDGGFVSYPVPLGSEPTAHVITPGDPVPSGCSGNSDSPSASTGHLCVFVDYELNTTGSYTIFGHDGFGGTSRMGFHFDVHSNAAGNYAVIGTWAVGAPLVISLDEEPPAQAGPASGVE